MAIDADLLVVGGYGDDQYGANAGSAYVFDRNAGGVGNWGEVAILHAEDARDGDFFGVHTAVSGGVITIASTKDDHWATDSGAVYVFGVPEPSTLVTLAGLCVMGLIAVRCRRKQSA